MRDRAATERPPQRSVGLRLVRNADHYTEVIERGVRQAKVSDWLATANLKDVHVEAPIGTRARARGRYVSLFDELGDAARSGIEVRILHGGPPSRVLAARMRAPGRRVARGDEVVEMRRCVRVHLKMIAIDGSLLYLGSANFTGAGLGAKSEGRRNFETGIVTSDDLMLDEMQAEFDAIWSGSRCAGCRLRTECPKPIDQLRRCP